MNAIPNAPTPTNANPPQVDPEHAAHNLSATATTAAPTGKTDPLSFAPETSANANPPAHTNAAAAPNQPATQVSTPAPAPDDAIAQLQCTLEAQRQRLNADLSELGARLSPQGMKTQAKASLEQAKESVATALDPRYLFTDARDGDPRALAIVTAGAVVLAGISVWALVRALRS